IGMFVNTLAIRNPVEPNDTFKHFLRQVKTNTVKAFENQDYPFEELVDQLGVNRDLNRNPLFDIAFSLEDMDRPEIEIPGLTLKPYKHENHIAKFDLTMFVVDTQSEELLFIVEYCTQLFKEETIQRFIGHFKRILTITLEQPGIKPMDIEIISDEEKQRILYEFNDTTAEYSRDKTIHQLFQEQAEQTPDTIAVVGPRGETVTYNELNRRSDALASVLIEKNVRPGDIVGIMAERSVETIIGLLGILKAGGAYLPVNMDYPEERIDFMLRDSGAGVLIGGGIPRCDTHTPAAGGGTLSIENTVPAYVIYTSGSTGKPKGVMAEHRGVVRLVRNTNYVAFNPGDRIMQTGALEFDASTFEIWGSLLNGLSLFLMDKEDLLTPGKLKTSLVNHDIATIFLTTSLFNQLSGSDVEVFSPLKNLLTGGDIISPFHIYRVKERFPLLNLIHVYGPTENTTFSTGFLIGNEYSRQIPIGKPIANSTVYIVDRNNYLQPINLAGELLTGGDGVARGYLNRPELTAKQFTKSFTGVQGAVFQKSPLAVGDTLIYKTGDLARWLEDGSLNFIGRADRQVKIRGFRIEPGEIETRLPDHINIREAVVPARENAQGDKYLCAYVTLTDADNFREPELRDFLMKDLPDYMVPAYFAVLETLPLTASGKINRDALPEPGFIPGGDYVPPASPNEKMLVDIWSGLLGIDKEKISVLDDFFRLGGHSLKAVSLMGRIHKTFSVEISITELFKNPFIRNIAQRIETLTQSPYFSLEPAEDKEYYPLVPTQEHFYFIHRLNPSDVAYNISQAQVIEGPLHREKFETVFKQLIDMHESLRTSFHLVEEELVQRIHPAVAFEIETIDLTANRANGSEDEYIPVIKNFIRPFDLSRAPLLRVGLIKIQEERHILVFDTHHIVMDGVSTGILISRFLSLYNGETPPPLTIRYTDYLHWALTRETPRLSTPDKEFNKLTLPTDYPRPSVQSQSFEGAVITVETGPLEKERLPELARKQGTTLYNVLLSIFNIFLSKISGSQDIVVGSPIAGRDHQDLEPLVGLFIKTVVLHNSPSGDKLFPEFLARVKANSLNAIAGDESQYEVLMEKAGLGGETDLNPLFDVMFILQNMDAPLIQIPGLSISPIEIENQTSKFDLTLICQEREKEGIIFQWEYSTRLFKEETIRRFIDHFNTIMSTILENPEIRISQIEIVTKEEKQRILYEFNDTGGDYSRDKTIHRLFEEQAEKTPDHIAVVDAHGAAITYNQLNREANRLAFHLAGKGVRPDTIVGIKIERSIEMVTGIFGILKAGGAYLPIDPDYPKERIDFMLRDSGAEVLIPNAKKYPSGSTSHLPSFPPSALAYIIYTSGSTGTPKGVMVEHSSVVNLLQYLSNAYPFSSSDTYLLKTSYTFDVSVTELFGWYPGGGRLAV
ncbi:MAG: amino acid adenylation domain-containing protein, partial [bacterium]|nr:amino acid adenylation domain-containing protein [bacterium]